MQGSVGERYLQELYGTSRRAEAFYKNQMIDFLNQKMVHFISEQEMMFIATADQKGHCDLSIRMGKTGFVTVLDEKTLIYPEYRGNGVLASLGNIYENPHIGILFVDFFRHTVGLHVNGSARLIDNDELKHQCHSLDPDNNNIHSIEDPKAERWVMITVEEAYIHCSKHIPLLQKAEKEMDWGTDDKGKKNGDYFRTAGEKKLFNE